ncbi:hypothetical protein QAD02_019070 [Eretmocerus hayati]|uniref:Uncharacterized protein n=1 Tax=Eretmocerus hayati TaxID=131215 RepID=A0ACC2PJQ2_9HYME|nr:hypothetical protein QAD02_019070 [Eretmocerus hayati]
MSRGNLKRPTPGLVRFLSVIEDSVLEVVGTLGINIDTLFQILDNLKTKSIPRIGCADHSEDLTKKLLNFYVVMRGSFLCDSANMNCSERNRISKQNRKNSKL